MAKNDFQHGGWNSFTLQCGTWLWDSMPLNAPKRQPYWNSTSDFDFDHIIAVGMLFCTSLRNFIQIGVPTAETMTSCRFSRWRISAILDFRGPIIGSLKSPCTASCRSSIRSKLIALNWLWCWLWCWLSFWENRAFFSFWGIQTNRQTNRQTKIWTGSSH